jgi:6-bladed beta-propeller
MTLRILVPVALGVLTAGCSAAQRGATHAPGAVHITRAAYDAMPRYVLSSRTQFCTDAHAKECLFRDIDFAFAGPHGATYLGERGGRLREFDSSGTFVRYIGGIGEGPGEYRVPAGGGVDSVGDVTIFDLRLFRLTSYAPDGTVLGSARVDTTPVGVTSWHVSGRSLLFFILPPAAAAGDTVQAAFLEVDADGRPGAVVRSFAAPARYITMAKHVVSAYAPVSMPPLFYPLPSWDSDARGAILFAAGDRLAVRRYDPGDSVPFRLAVDLAPRPVTSADVEAEIERLSQPTPGAPAAMQQAMKASLERQAKDAAKVFPMIRSVQLLTDGTIVIEEWAMHDAPQVRWDLFGAAGRPLGFLDLPAGARVSDGNLDRVLIVSHDKDGVAHAGWFRPVPQ